jgi:hypothetical protein
MMSNHRLLRAIGVAIAASFLPLTAAQADVTIQQKTNLDVASMIKMHGSTTSSISSDKKRDDTESHCEGVMSMFCGNLRGGEIVRLDRGVTWYLEPDKKRYRETVFATPEEIAAMRAKMQANLEKMRSCPVSQKQQPIDQSKCEMSPAKIEVRKTDDKMSIIGHDAQRTSATLTETCTNKETGDVCDMVVAIDLWLTQDAVPGAADRRTFELAYAKKLGLDDPQGAMRGEVAKFLAPYQSQIKQLQEKSGDLKGLPLRTSLRVLMGGAQCSAMAKSKAAEATGGAGSAAPGNPLAGVTQAGKAVGNLVGSLFHKKKADDPQSPPADSSAAASAASGAPGAAGASPAIPDPFAQLVQMAAFSIETVSINTDAVPVDRFDVPADWTKETPKPAKGGDDEFSCPKTAG